MTKAFKDNFNIFENSELVDILPNKFMVSSPEKQKEIEDFFSKIPKNKVMCVKFPDEKLWKLYNGRLKLYASLLKIKDISIHTRKDDTGYYIYVKRKGDDVNEKNMEIKSV